MEQRELKKRGLPKNDNRNALRLCLICHEHHTNAFDRIPVTKLLDCNLEYAFEVLGAWAEDYINRYYSGGSDERMKRLAASA